MCHTLIEFVRLFTSAADFYYSTRSRFGLVLLPLFALRRDVRRALLWVGILALFYFCHGIAEGWSSSSERWLALVEIVLTLLLIGALGAGVQRKPAR